MKKFLAQFHN